MQYNTKFYTNISILAASGTILMYFQLPYPFLTFLKLDASEVPVLLGAFAFGPVAGIVIELIKNILHLFSTQSAGIGELANFIAGSTFAGTAGVIYRKNRTLRGAAWGLIAGTAAMAPNSSIY